MIANKNLSKTLQLITAFQSQATRKVFIFQQERQLFKQNIPVRCLTTSSILFHPRFVKQSIEENEISNESSRNEAPDVQLDTLTEIESDLFENKKNIPVSINTKQIFLKRFESEKLKQQKNKHINYSKIQQPKKKSEPIVIEDPVLGLKFTKLENNDSKFSTLLMMARSKKKRDKDQKIIIEGKRLILEGITCGLNLETLVFSQRDKIESIKLELQQHCKQTEIYKITQHNLKTWSTLTTPPGIIGIFQRPSYNKILMNIKDKPLPVTVICDNIREPNNLGAIIRTCSALPCAEIYIPKGCCDPWESKALRSGCGGQFRIKIKDDLHWEEIDEIVPKESTVFIAENNFDSNKNQFVNYLDIKIINEQHNTVIIGGETYGISEDAYQFMNLRKNNSCCVHIPLANGIESLNTSSALTLILYELRKKIMENNLNSYRERNEIQT